MITITFGSWMIPTAIMVIGLVWAVFIVDAGTGYGAGVANIIALVPVLFVSCIAWMIWGFCR